jgi:uncharacterized protein (TIGR02569 family)
VSIPHPPAEVLTAFGAGGEARLLPGGQGGTWQVGDVVLKPSGSPAEAAWVAEVLSTLPASPRYQAVRPVRATGGSWVVSGWEAWYALPGATDPRRWDDVLEVGKAFHQALAGLPRPDFLDARDNPWTYGERIAWEDLPLSGTEVMAELLEPLAQARRPVDLPAQPVHGDLLGNVIFAEGHPPAIIDWPVYFRPPAWALAVVVVDALTWHGAPAALADRGSGTADWEQLLVRALMFRIATNEGFRREGLRVRESVETYRHVVEQVLSRT